MKRLFLFLSIALMCSHAWGQYNAPQNMVWTFGLNVSVDFNSGSPVPGTCSLSTDEGCASVCDASGNLLFYTEGVDIRNATHAVMPSGAAIVPYGTYTTTQGVSIVPMPGSPSKYYVFSLGTSSTTGPYNKLSYSIVDMSLDGGLGDVSTAGVALAVTDSLSEKMVTVPGNGCNVWLIIRRRSMPDFLVYNITSSGISAPIISSFGSYAGSLAFFAGVLKVSHDRTKIVSQSQPLSGPGLTELFDFDPATGIVSNRQLLETSDQYVPYGAEFSPDNTRLYSSLGIMVPPTVFSRIWQYDLTLPTTSLISASRTTVATFSDLARRDLKLAPDGKIYIPNPSGFLDCIASPDLLGTGCIYVSNAVAISTGTPYSGLPNTVMVPVPDYDTAVSHIALCRPDTGSIMLTPASAGTHYTWYDGATSPTHSVSATGTYWVRITNGCTVLLDTFHVILDTIPSISIGNDTTINAGDVIVLTAAPPGIGYVWNTGKTGDTLHVGAAGTYWVASPSTDLCPAAFDTIVINVTAGVTDIAGSANVSLFPNPAYGQVTVSATGLESSTVNVGCYNILGVEVASQTARVTNGACKVSMSTGHLPPGIYSVRVGDGKKEGVVRRLIVQR